KCGLRSTRCAVPVPSPTPAPVAQFPGGKSRCADAIGTRANVVRVILRTRYCGTRTDSDTQPHLPPKPHASNDCVAATGTVRLLTCDAGLARCSLRWRGPDVCAVLVWASRSRRGRRYPAGGVVVRLHRCSLRLASGVGLGSDYPGLPALRRQDSVELVRMHEVR